MHIPQKHHNHENHQQPGALVQNHEHVSRSVPKHKRLFSFSCRLTGEAGNEVVGAGLLGRGIDLFFREFPFLQPVGDIVVDAVDSFDKWRAANERKMAHCEHKDEHMSD